jgi:hypothetical protein
MHPGDNVVGPKIVKTEDSGIHWAQVFPDNSTKEKLNLYLAAASKSATAAVVTGVFYDAYSTDGSKFTASKNEFVDPAQDAKVIPDGRFAIVIDGNKAQG